MNFRILLQQLVKNISSRKVWFPRHIWDVSSDWGSNVAILGIAASSVSCGWGSCARGRADLAPEQSTTPVLSSATGGKLVKRSTREKYWILGSAPPVFRSGWVQSRNSDTLKLSGHESYRQQFHGKQLVTGEHVEQDSFLRFVLFLKLKKKLMLPNYASYF